MQGFKFMIAVIIVLIAVVSANHLHRLPQQQKVDQRLSQNFVKDSLHNQVARDDSKIFESFSQARYMQVASAMSQAELNAFFRLVCHHIYLFTGDLTNISVQDFADTLRPQGFQVSDSDTYFLYNFVNGQKNTNFDVLNGCAAKFRREGIYGSGIRKSKYTRNKNGQTKINTPMEDLIKIKTDFHNADLDGSKTLDHYEFIQILKKYNLYEPFNTEGVMMELDKNNDGEIDYSEFLALF